MERENEANSTDEIEISPEVIKAGVAALVAYNPDFELEDEAACRIYRAMVKAARQRRE